MDNLDKEFVPYQIALDMKSIGFDKSCLAFSYVKSEFGYIDHEVYLIDYLSDDSIVKNSEKEYYYARPTFSQAFKFFRDKYGLFHYPQSVDEFRQDVWWEFVVYGKTRNKRHVRCQPAETYEEAELECIKKLIEIVKNKELYEFGNNPVRG